MCFFASHAFLFWQDSSPAMLICVLKVWNWSECCFIGWWKAMIMSAMESALWYYLGCCLPWYVSISPLPTSYLNSVLCCGFVSWIHWHEIPCQYDCLPNARLNFCLKKNISCSAWNSKRLGIPARAIYLVMGKCLLDLRVFIISHTDFCSETATTQSERGGCF